MLRTDKYFNMEMLVFVSRIIGYYMSHQK